LWPLEWYSIPQSWLVKETAEEIDANVHEEFVNRWQPRERLFQDALLPLLV
jgi:hypothetical protein